jgi:hypothetical protein
MNYAMREDHAHSVKALPESMTGDRCRLIETVHGKERRYYVERWTGSEWVRA